MAWRIRHSTAHRPKHRRHLTTRFFRSYDALLAQTVLDATPRVGLLDPTADW
jgi:hypothetical protein